MNDRDTLLVWILALLNAGAFGLWVTALRFRVVVDRPDLAGTRALAHRGRGIVERCVLRMRGGAASWTGRLRDGLRLPRWTAALRTRGRRLAEVAAGNALDSWIEEVERVETQAPQQRGDEPSSQPATPDAGRETTRPASGSEEWWRDWAATGGVLPQPASSRRRHASRTQPPA